MEFVIDAVVLTAMQVDLIRERTSAKGKLSKTLHVHDVEKDYSKLHT